MPGTATKKTVKKATTKKTTKKAVAKKTGPQPGDQAECPTCGKKLKVRNNGKVGSHEPTQRYRSINRLNFWAPCPGSNTAPTTVVKTKAQLDAAKKKRETEKQEKLTKAEKADRDRRAKKRKELGIDVLSDEAQKNLSKAIMTFQEPSICPNGRLRFLDSVGLPRPPKMVQVTVTLEREALPGEVTQYGDVSAKVSDKVIKELAVPAEVKVTQKTVRAVDYASGRRY